MDKSNLELFKQALSEGVSNRFDKMAAECTEEIVCSDKHNLAMKTIVYGKAATKRHLSPKAKRLIAILVAAAILLTSCGIIFRNEIRQIFEEVCDFFVALTYTEDGSKGATIEEIYELSYLPEGYSLEKEVITPVCTQYEFKNENGDYIWFEQKLLDGTDFYVDSESGYTQMNNVKDYEVYYRYTGEKHVYVWNDSNYSMKLSSSIQISSDEIVLILKGLKIK
ncbi:MAG: DUF4367 domain-containing protein [Clostridia bacterium]|nr:DUF4367 domain-containing protein [Clostridia bacterium]